MNRTKDFFKSKIGFRADKFHSYMFSGTGIIYDTLMVEEKLSGEITSVRRQSDGYRAF